MWDTKNIKLNFKVEEIMTSQFELSISDQKDRRKKQRMRLLLENKRSSFVRSLLPKEYYCPFK